MVSPSWRGGSAAATSALGNTRLDKYHIGLELRCPQPLQGLERWRICIRQSKQRSELRHDRRKSTAMHQTLHTVSRSDATACSHAPSKLLPPAGSVTRDMLTERIVMNVDAL